MAAERNQHRILSVTTRVACGFTIFLIAVILPTHYNPFVRNISPGDLDNQLLPIVVAKVEIPAGTRITAEQLTVSQSRSTVLPYRTFARVDGTILGRIAVARISSGEPVTEDRLFSIRAAGGLSSVIANGYRAMTVKVDDVVGVSGFIMPGSLVDIVVTSIPPDNSKRRKKALAKTVLENLKVLASGQNLDKSKDEKGVTRAVTLQVTREQAEKLTLASIEGKLRLVMRYPVE
jgi:pilus assembly protein CpaB